MNERRDDWNNSVEKRLVDLNSAQLSTDVSLAKIEEALSKIDDTLRGDSQSDGLVASMHEAQKDIRKFNAILLDYDSAGNPGMLKKIDLVLSRRARGEKREGYLWTFFTAVVVQFLILIGLLVVNWDHIREYVTLHEHIQAAASIEKTTKKLKSKRARRKRPAPVVAPAGAVNADPETSLP